MIALFAKRPRIVGRASARADRNFLLRRLLMYFLGAFLLGLSALLVNVIGADMGPVSIVLGAFYVFFFQPALVGPTRGRTVVELIAQRVRI